VIRVYDNAGNVTETHEQAGDFNEWLSFTLPRRTFRQKSVPMIWGLSGDREGGNRIRGTAHLRATAYK
jgi:hypothetical protein